MDLKNLSDLVREEFQKIKLPQEFEIDVRPHSEVYPHSQQSKDSYMIKISIGSEEEDPEERFYDNICSFLDFWYNKEENRLENVNFKLVPEFRGKGIGRKLVKSMEEVGRKLGCEYVQIDLNTNPDFWEHVGYKRKENYWEKQILSKTSA